MAARNLLLIYFSSLLHQWKLMNFLQVRDFQLYTNHVANLPPSPCPRLINLFPPAFIPSHRLSSLPCVVCTFLAYYSQLTVLQSTPAHHWWWKA